MLTPEERSLRAKLAAHALHSRCDSKDLTAKARETFLARFEAEVDPEGILSPEERRRRAEHARKAYFARIALKSAKSRRTKTERKHSPADSKYASKAPSLKAAAPPTEEAAHEREV